MAFTPQDYDFMVQALRLAERGLYTTQPNPRVGCILVREGEIVGKGWHQCAGSPHAEVNALRQAGARARRATAYVTLEPCCHHGRTGPCTQALIEAGLCRVVVAMEDPFPRVAGNGLRILRGAGIKVDVGLLQTEAQRLNQGFVTRFTKERPLIRCKLAMTLDGRTAAANGESKWITSEAARLDVQRWRARSSAILTGIGTVLADDPALTVRRLYTDTNDSPIEVGDEFKQPTRVVLDSHTRMPLTARMLRLPGETLVFTTKRNKAHHQALIRAGAVVRMTSVQQHQVALKEVVRELAGREVNELLLEAGPILSGAFLEAGLIDEFVFYVAPQLLGDNARGLFHAPGFRKLADRVELAIEDIRAVGSDWRIIARAS